jgi:hypothetical protein
MCPEHRTKVLAEIKTRLTEKKRCIVISTQLIEAGVDIDFPCVYRAMAGIDAIAQAAGRCNREGKLDRGDVHVFTPECGLPKGWFQRMAMLGEEVMGLYPNPLLPEAVAKFFELRYGLGANLDAEHILRDIKDGGKDLSFQFKEIEDKYKLIGNSTIGVIIPYDDKCAALIYEAEKAQFPLKYLRKLQRYTVSIYSQELEALKSWGYLKEFAHGVFALNPENMQECYSEKLGLLSGKDIALTDLII